MPADGLPDRLEQQLPGPAEKAADDHALRVDEVAQAGDRDTDLAAGVGDGSAAADVALRCKLDDPAERQRLRAALAHKLQDCRTRRHRLETASVSAVAERSALVQ